MFGLPEWGRVRTFLGTVDVKKHNQWFEYAYFWSIALSGLLIINKFGVIFANKFSNQIDPESIKNWLQLIQIHNMNPSKLKANPFKLSSQKSTAKWFEFELTGQTSYNYWRNSCSNYSWSANKSLLYTFPINPAVGRVVSAGAQLHSQHQSRRIFDRIRERASDLAGQQPRPFISCCVPASTIKTLRAPAHPTPAVKVTHPQPKAATALCLCAATLAQSHTHVCVHANRKRRANISNSAAEEWIECVCICTDLASVQGAAASVGRAACVDLSLRSAGNAHSWLSHRWHTRQAWYGARRRRCHWPLLERPERTAARATHLHTHCVPWLVGSAAQRLPADRERAKCARPAARPTRKPRRGAQ
jgi:hypothetical protein